MSPITSISSFQAIKEWVTAIPRDTSVGQVGTPDVCLATTQGIKRESNEDRACFACITSSGPNRGPIYIGAVCDGLGGMKAGAECASIAISTLLYEFAARIWHEDPRLAFLRAIRTANDEIFRRYRGDGGTTIAAVLASRSKILGVTCGDSRIYGVSASGRASQLSVDDTIAAEVKHVASLSASKLKDLEFGEHLTQYLGAGPDVHLHEIDGSTLSQHETIFLLSDGAWRSSDDAFLKIISHAPGVFEAVRRMITISNWCGGVDNMTAVAIPKIAGLFPSAPAPYPPTDTVQLDLWNPFGQLSALVERHVTGQFGEQQRREPQQASFLTLVDQDSTVKRLDPKKSGSESRELGQLGRLKKGGGKKTRASGSSKRGDPKQLAIQIEVHEPVSTSKSSKSRRTREGSGDGRHTVRKTKSTR